MPLFEATPSTIAFSYTMGTGHTRSKNAISLGDSCFYSLTQFLWLLHILNILGSDNATF